MRFARRCEGVPPALSVVYEGYEFKWMDLPKEKGVGFPIEKPAQAKLIRNVINALKLRVAQESGRLEVNWLLVLCLSKPLTKSWRDERCTTQSKTRWNWSPELTTTSITGTVSCV